VERGDLVMVFNFHPTNSYTDYKVGCKDAGEEGGMMTVTRCCVVVVLCWCVAGGVCVGVPRHHQLHRDYQVGCRDVRGVVCCRGTVLGDGGNMGGGGSGCVLAVWVGLCWLKPGKYRLVLSL
jgi:hypothetical protein